MTDTEEKPKTTVLVATMILIGSLVVGVGVGMLMSKRGGYNAEF